MILSKKCEVAASKIYESICFDCWFNTKSIVEISGLSGYELHQGLKWLVKNQLLRTKKGHSAASTEYKKI